jgi:hypothetical protein
MKRYSTILSFVIVLAICSIAAACPACKDSIPSSDAQAAGALPGGFNQSVFFMLGGFIGVLTLVTTMIVRTVRGPGDRGNGFPLQ